MRYRQEYRKRRGLPLPRDVFALPGSSDETPVLMLRTRALCWDQISAKADVSLIQRHFCYFMQTIQTMHPTIPDYLSPPPNQT